jgi:hypothetical protein
VADTKEWLYPLKCLLAEYGQEPVDWSIERGDTFQLEIRDPARVLHVALHIKSLIKSLKIKELDIRMAIGIGNKTFQGSRVSESNGEAFINCGDTFDRMKNSNETLAIKTPWSALDREFNLLFRLAAVFIDKWTTPSAEAMYFLFETDKKMPQKELVQKLNINQSSVSERLARANSEEVLELEQYFRDRIKQKMAE